METPIKTDSTAILTDFYSLTMSQGYWKRGAKEKAVFEMFFRHQPFGGGYSIFAGLENLLENIINFSFSNDDIEYLKSLKIFEDGFIDFLKDFRFKGNLWAMDEGNVCFPQEPLIRVEGTLIECQLIEGMLLNIINFQSLIATKACRIWIASGKSKIMEFGLRRAQGHDGALSATRAAYIGGASGTSNTKAGKVYGIPVMGTMAHSWVMSFDTEEEAFEKYAEIYPDRCVFLIDTYDTLKSGIQNAIKVGKKLAEKGKTFGVRLDSGDIQYLSQECRKILDAAGLTKAFITVSNDLDEHIIETLVRDKAPVDSWGVGTQLVTGAKAAALTGVYKLAMTKNANGSVPVMKFSDNPEKTTNPGAKQVWRIFDKNGCAIADVLGIDGVDQLKAGDTARFWHPSADYRHFTHTIAGRAEPLLKKHIENGGRVGENPSLEAIRANMEKNIDSLDATHKRHLNPHVYKVSITERLRSLKLELIEKYIGTEKLGAGV